MLQTHQSRFLTCLHVIMVHTRAIFASDVLPLHQTGINIRVYIDRRRLFITYFFTTSAKRKEKKITWLTHGPINKENKKGTISRANIKT
jgi:hypothetical protein